MVTYKIYMDIQSQFNSMTYENYIFEDSDQS